MLPYDDFTPHGYLDNPYHSWKLNPSGVLRSLSPLGMGWHVPNFGSYARNQFQYTAHLAVGFKIGKMVLVTPGDFKRYGCSIVSHVHTKNRFEYTCTIPKYALTIRVRYFLVNENALGCILTLATTARQAFPVTCYLMHRHTHNPNTSRLWEHGLYALPGPQEGVCMLGLASEGDVFVHGARAADGGELTFGEMGYAIALEDAAIWAHGISVAPPNIAEHEESTGWQERTLVLPCTVVLEGSGSGASERIVNAVLTRGVSQDQSYERWLEGIEEIARADGEQRADDEEFWAHAPQLSGDWPASWRRGLVYDFETLRMVVRPSAGVVGHFFDGMQIQAPRLVLAEAAMDMLFLSYGDPELAAEVMLGHFESAPRANLPCMREDGSYNMVADDGQICGTAPPWGYPLWCCDLLWRKLGNVQWLLRLYPKAAAYLRWWLENRRDPGGWLVYACSWESGQDVSRRFGPQQTGGTIIQHVRPVDLQASMAQGAEILVRWAALLGQEQTTTLLLPSAIDFAAEEVWWQQIANEFTAKTRYMWRDGWFHDYDAQAQEWSALQDSMQLAPVFCGAASEEQVKQLREHFARLPLAGGSAELAWPPVVLTLIESAYAAGQVVEAAELSYQFIDAAYRSADRPTLDEYGGLPGVTREYHAAGAEGKWQKVEYMNAGIEGYGWGALSIHLLVQHVLGVHAQDAGSIEMMPMFPQALRKVGASYSVGPIAWGGYLLSVTCVMREAQGYSMHMRCTTAAQAEDLVPQEAKEREWNWDGVWGDVRLLQLP